MSEVASGWRRFGWATVLTAAALAVGASATVATGGGPDAVSHPSTTVDGIARCSTASRPAPTGVPRMHFLLDERGWLSGHRLSAPGLRPVVTLGRHATLHGPFGHRWVYSDASAGRTSLRVLDSTRGCIEAVLRSRGLVFAVTVDVTGAALYHDLVDPRTRRDLGIWKRTLGAPRAPELVTPGVAPDTFELVWGHRLSWSSDGALRSEACGPAVCSMRVVDFAGDLASQPSSGADLSTEQPSPEAKPVPESESDVWADDALLRFRWADGAPSAWMRNGIIAAAGDASSSRDSNAPIFSYDANGPDSVRVATDLPGNCSPSLACATRDIPNYWIIRIRPQGYEFPWGTLRWCEAYQSPPNGCLGVERTMIHEFGHVAGLAHPDEGGMRLGALDTVMHDLIPSRPNAGWSLHRFGACDVARLQRRYGLPYSSARLATCERVETRLTIDVSDTSIGFQDPVTITATLSVRDRDGYDRLAGDPLSGRDVVIQRRSAGASGWASYDAEVGYAAGTYHATFRPSVPSEFRAVFTRSSDDGVIDDTSGIVEVFVGGCSDRGCPTSQQVTNAWRH